MLTSSLQEAQERCIDMSDHDEETIEALLCYMYSFKYTGGHNQEECVLHLKLALLADKYNISHLIPLVVQNFKKRLAFDFKVTDVDGH